MRTTKLLYSTTQMVLTDIMLRGRSCIQKKACCLLLYKLILPFIQSMETGQDISGRFQIGALTGKEYTRVCWGAGNQHFVFIWMVSTNIKKPSYIHMIYALYYVQIILHFEMGNYLQT